MTNRKGNGKAQSADVLQAREGREESKKLLKEFRDHYEELDKDRDEILDCRSDALELQFEKAARNVSKIKTVDQAHADAQVFRKLGEYSRRHAAQLQTGLKDYGVKSFVDALVNTLANDEVLSQPPIIDYMSVGESVHKLWKNVPSTDFMYGNMVIDDDEQPVKVKRVRNAKRAVKGKVTTKPADLEKGDVEQTETDKQVTYMKKELKRIGQINFWEFVVDPTPEVGFTRTIENVFHCSFLVKDMFAQLDLAQEPPLITYTDPSAVANDVANGSATAENEQYVMGIDSNLYKSVIAKYKITRPVLKPMSQATRNN